MEWVVTTGRTVDEAKDAALDELGVDEADAEFEILEEPRQGLFGRQRGEARVRARVRPTAPRPKVDRRDRRRRRAGDHGSDDEAVVSTLATPASSSVAASSSVSAASSTELGSGGSPSAARSRRRRRDGKASDRAVADEAGSGRRRPAAEARSQTGAGLRTESEEPTVTDDEFTLAEQGDVARQFLVGLLEAFGMPAAVEVAELDDDTVELRVTGQELGLLIGPKGQTLSALQELTRTAVQRRSAARTGRLLVDVAGYRQRRKEALERFTRQVAEDVVASGVQRVLEPMSAADRKIVHDTANEIPGVRTTSEGEDPRRRVVLIPETAES